MSIERALFVEIDMICQNLLQGYFLEVGLMQIPANHETLFIIYDAQIHVDFLLALGFHFLV